MHETLPQQVMGKMVMANSELMMEKSETPRYLGVEASVSGA